MAARLVSPPAYLVIDLDGVLAQVLKDHAGAQLVLNGTAYAIRQLLLEALDQLPATEL
jgi:hypothetical protein